MLSPKHKQEIKKLLQKVYQHPARKKASPAERFLSGNPAAASFGSRPNRPPTTSTSHSTTNRNTRPSQRSTAGLSNERQSKTDWTTASGGYPQMTAGSP